jgi:phosphoribosylformylglycinamidine synthase subunit PurS
MPHAALLDPQGKAISGGLKNLGINSVNDVRAGKYIELTFENCSREEALELARTAAEKLLANPVMESFEVLSAEEV